MLTAWQRSSTSQSWSCPKKMLSRPTSIRAIVDKLRSGASVTEANESILRRGGAVAVGLPRLGHRVRR